MNRRQWLRRFALAGCPLGLAWLSGCGSGRQTQEAAGVAAPAAEPKQDLAAENTLPDRGSADILLFDIFGTVVDWKASLIAQFQQFGRQRGCSADWEALASQWQAAYLPSLEDVRQNRRPFVGLETLRRESLDRMLPGLGLDSLADADRAELVRCWSRLQAWPDAVAGLTRLHRKFILMALSNGGFGLLVDMARYAGLPWDAVLSADLFHHFKPDAEVYRGTAELLARPASSLTLVASHNIDLAAARACGWKTAYLQRPTEDAKPTADWDIIVQDFPELANKLGA